MNKVILALCSAALTAYASAAPDGASYIRQNGWTQVPVSLPQLPVSDIAPVVFIRKDASAPSCGLLVPGHAGPALIDIVGPDAESDFPQCLSINDVAAFKVNAKAYLVFEAIVRDTREDFYREYFYVYKEADGRYVPDAALNDSTAWSGPLRASAGQLNSPRANEGVRRARGTILSRLLPGSTLLERDFIADEHRAFGVFQNKQKQTCGFAVDTGTSTAKFDHTAFSRGDQCGTVLAASKLDKDGVTYYLALFNGAAGSHLAAISVNAEGRIAAESKLAISASRKRQLTDIRTAKTALLAELR